MLEKSCPRCNAIRELENGAPADDCPYCGYIYDSGPERKRPKANGHVPKRFDNGFLATTYTENGPKPKDQSIYWTHTTGFGWMDPITKPCFKIF